jgi:hypothetical protein
MRACFAYRLTGRRIVGGVPSAFHNVLAAVEIMSTTPRISIRRLVSLTRLEWLMQCSQRARRRASDARAMHTSTVYRANRSQTRNRIGKYAASLIKHVRVLLSD